ncbi:hypothetical protein IJH02_03380 [Candidatus Saccharibacteria bacterium]|nr:hypothetical protein [Candidatus Saccharibacteria bacterium]
MSKTTKIIAALGVVSGLGVAAMPALTFADTSVSGNVKVEVEITPAIAMKIHSNNDQNNYTYNAVTPEGSENPSEEGWYVLDNGDYVASEDTTVQPGTTYYEQIDGGNFGFVGYEPASAQASGDLAPNAGPSLATGLQLSANQADLTTLWSDIYVRSNTGSFKIELNDADDDTALRNASVSTTANEFIPAQSGEPVAATAGWAVSVDDSTTWVAVPAGASSDYDAEQGTGTAAETPLTVLASGTNTTNPLAYSAAKRVNYGIASGLTKTGVYSDIITYTATTQ